MTQQAQTVRSQTFQTPSRSARIKDYLGVIFRRLPVVALSLITVLLSTVFYVNQIEDVFESYSTLVIEYSNPLINEALKKAPRSISFYQGMLNSHSFIDLVIDSVGLDFINKSLSGQYSGDGRDRARAYLRHNISLKVTEYESFLQLTARANTRELSYFIASCATDIFRKRCQEVESEESRRAVVEIEKQLEHVRSKLEQAEHDFTAFKDRTGNIDEGTTPELKTLQDAYGKDLAQLGILEADLKAEKIHLDKLEALITPTGTQAPPEISKLRNRLRDLEKEKLRLESLGIRLSAMSTIDREIQEIERQLVEYKRSSESPVSDPNTIRRWQELRKSVINRETDFDLFKARLGTYKRSIDSYKKDNPDILAHSLELLRLKRSKEIYENVYGYLLEKAEEERIQSASSSAGIKIVDIARMPDKPIPKNEMRFYIMGIVLGLALGLPLAFLLEYNDTTIKTTEDIEKILGLPVLGTIPHIIETRKEKQEGEKNHGKGSKNQSLTHNPRHLLNFAGSDSVTTESYRSLRTNLSFVSPDNPVRCVLVTSAGPSEGKSLTIANLAMAYAQLGKRILLVDTDLRRPVQHKLFSLSREPGFAELFQESPEYEKSIRSTGRENLYICTAGMFSPNPAELIGSQKMLHHIEYFKQHFDMIFFDTPPIVAVTDATLLGKKIDGVLLVIRSHHTDRDFGQRALSTLSNVGVRILGTVLNDINLSQRYSSYSYYKYYYHYYRSQKS